MIVVIFMNAPNYPSSGNLYLKILQDINTLENCLKIDSPTTSSSPKRSNQPIHDISNPIFTKKHGLEEPGESSSPALPTAKKIKMEDDSTESHLSQQISNANKQFNSIILCLSNSQGTLSPEQMKSCLNRLNTITEPVLNRLLQVTKNNQNIDDTNVLMNREIKEYQELCGKISTIRTTQITTPLRRSYVPINEQALLNSVANNIRLNYEQTLNTIADVDQRYLLFNKLITCAIKNKKPEILELLLKIPWPKSDKYHIDTPGSNGLTPLETAVIYADLPICKLLIDHGADIYRTNEKGNTLLHLAVTYSRLDTCNFLLGKLAPPEEKLRYINKAEEHGLTALHLAASYGNVGLYRTLLNHGADPHIGDAEGYLPITRGKGLRTIIDTFDRCIHDLLQSSEYAKAHSKEHIGRKMLSAALEIEGFTQLVMKAAPEGFERQPMPQSLPLAGFFGQYWWYQYAKDLPAYQTFSSSPSIDPNISGYIDNDTTYALHNAFEFAADDLKMTLKQKYDRWEKGAPLILNTGFKQHFVSMLIWGDRLIIVNRGPGRSEEAVRQGKAILAFKFHKELFSAESIRRIENIVTTLEQNYQDFISKTLKEQLCLEKTDFEKVIESIHLPSQEAPNCSFANSEGLIWPFLALIEIIKNIGNFDSVNPNVLKEAIIKQSHVHASWLSFQKLLVVEKYLDKIQQPNRMFEADFALLSMSIINGMSKAYSTQFYALMSRWEKVVNSFLTIAPAEIKQNFQVSLAALPAFAYLNIPEVSLK